MAWTAQDIPDQSGRVAVVTGATSGLGTETAIELARRGAHVVLTARDAGRGETALAAVRAVGSAEVASLDLADLSTVRAFADRFAGAYDRLDLLVNNAGVMATPAGRTADGFELQMGINHLGHFVLTGRLLPLLLGTSGSRVVTVASQAHRLGRLNPDDLNRERRRYLRWPAYSDSKLANLLFAFELSRRLVAVGAGTASLAAHPGLARSNLGLGYAGLLGRLQTLAFRLTAPVVQQSTEQGALPQLRAATDPDLPTGTFVGPSGPGGSRGAPVPVGSSAPARDLELAGRLWAVSEELTHTAYAEI
jgi:NAD(P)-dependent dehydrogenase (short-subunit alcohol dehydrogenase family)